MHTLKQISIILVALAVVLLATPALAQSVETDYDHSVNFNQYHTYSWGRVHASDPFFESRIRDAVDHALQAKGWRLVPDDGDVTVVAVAIKRHQREYTTFYDGLGGGWRWRGWGLGMSTTSIDKVPVGTLIVDMYDSSSRRLIWRGMASDQLTDKPDKDTKKLQKAVDKMLAKFPPQRM